MICFYEIRVRVLENFWEKYEIMCIDKCVMKWDIMRFKWKDKWKETKESPRKSHGRPLK